MNDYQAKEMIKQLSYGLTAFAFISALLDYASWNPLYLPLLIIHDLLDIMLLTPIWVSMLTIYVIFEIKRFLQRWLMFSL